jgi:hypothetical protein
MERAAEPRPASVHRINGSVAALRFLFTVTLHRSDMARHLTFVREPRKVPVVLSPEEVAPSGGRTRAEVQDDPRCGLRRGPARIRGRVAEGVRRRQQAHAAQDRAGQGPQGPPCHVVTAAARASARLVSHQHGRRSDCFPDRTRSATSQRGCYNPAAVTRFNEAFLPSGISATRHPGSPMERRRGFTGSC